MKQNISRLLSLLLSFCLLAGLLPSGLLLQEVKAEGTDRDVLYSCDFETDDAIDRLLFLDVDADGQNWAREDDFTGNYGLVSYAVEGTENVFRLPYFLLPDTEDITLSFKVLTDGAADYVDNLGVYVYVSGESAPETPAKSYVLKADDTGRTNPGTFQVDLSEWKGREITIAFDNSNQSSLSTGDFSVRIDDILVTAPAKETVIVSSYDQLCNAIATDTIDGRTLQMKLSGDIFCTVDGDGKMIKLQNAQQRVVLDLNGHTVSRTAKTKKDYALICLDKGELTIKDSSNGSGEIAAALTFNGNEIFPRASTVCVEDHGRLTIEGGQFFSDKGIDSAVCVRYGSDSRVTINGGRFIGAKYGLNILNGYVENAEHLTVNGGTFDGGIRGICLTTNSPYVRINNATSGSSVLFATSRSNVPSNISPNTVVTVYKNESEIDKVYYDNTEFSSPFDDKQLRLDGYKIVFCTKPAMRYLAIVGQVPRPGETAGSLFDSDKSMGAFTFREFTWFDENGNRFSGEFCENVSYKLSVMIEAEQGEVFSKDFIATLNRERADVHFVDEGRKKVIVSYTFPPTEVRKLTGEVQFTSAANPGKPISCVLKNLPIDLNEDNLQFQWQVKVGDTWEDIQEEGATGRNFAPSADLLGKEIRFVATEPQSIGRIVSGSVTVKKLFNPAWPAEPGLIIRQDENGKYTKLIINNYNAKQEYVCLTSKVYDTAEIDWTANTFDTDTMTGLTEGTTYYVYTRIKETDTTQASVGVRYGSIVLKDPQYLQNITLEGYTRYGDGNTIYIPVGEDVTINVIKEPDAAQSWSYFKFGFPSSQSVYTVTAGETVQDTMPAWITLHGNSVGESTLKAYYNSGMYDYGTWRVSVYDPANVGTSITFTDRPTYDNITLTVGDSFTPEMPAENLMLPAEANDQYMYKWYVYEGVAEIGGSPYGMVTDNGYISVDPDTGEVTALSDVLAAKGEIYQQSVMLYAVNRTDSSKYSKVAEYKVTVNPEAIIPVEGITVLPSEVTMKPGAQKALVAVVNPVNTTVVDTMTWSKVSGSDNVSVDASGKVTVSEAAVTGETATLQAKYGGKTGTCVVTVAVKTYTVNVTDGAAYDKTGTLISQAEPGDVVTLKANTSASGKVFDKWVVESDNTALADAYNATTTFKMPEGDVSVKATYRDAQVVPAPEDKGDKTPAVGTSLTDESGKATYKVTTAAGTDGASARQPAVEYVAPLDKNAKSVSIPSTITAGGVTYKVTAIADNAFKNNKNLTTMKIGSNVITIGKNAFYGCKNLQKVTIGNGVTTIGAGAFSGCSKLKTLTIGKNVTTIGDKAFYKCAALTKITIPSKVNKIGKQAFYGCKKLKSITIKTTKLTSKKVAKNAFGKNAKKVTVTLPKLAKSKKTAYAKMLKTKGLKKAKFK